MRVGVTLPSMGHLSQPDNLIQAAKAAERLGYDTLWVADRLLYPIKPRTKYSVTADGRCRRSTSLRSSRHPHLCRRAHDADRLGHERPRHSLLQPGHSRAPLDHVGYSIERTAAHRFGLGWSVGADRSIFAGSLDQVKRDIDDVKKLDANEIFLMIFPDGPIEDLVAVMERYRSLVSQIKIHPRLRRLGVHSAASVQNR